MIYFSAISTYASPWNERTKACKETWAKTLVGGDELHFIYGDQNQPSVPNDFLSIQGYAIGTQDIYYPIADSYEKVLFKTILNMRDFLKTKHSFYVRTHVGSYIHLGKYHAICKALPQNNLYGGPAIRNKRLLRGSEVIYTDYASGSCFVMSRDVVERYLSVATNHPMTYATFDDVAIGFVVTKTMGLNITEIPWLHVHSQNDIPFHPDVPQYYLTYESGKTPECMWEIHRTISNQEVISK